MAASRGVVRPSLLSALVAVTAMLFVACGGDDDGASPELSPAGEAGEELYNNRGCAGCHANNVGPSFDGLAGSEVELDDGTTVIADEEYLTRSITDPQAQVVDGYSTQMPTTDLSEEEVSQLVAYIQDLSPEASGGSVTSS